MDVSDGLIQDLGHLCRASRVSARIDARLVPRSPAALSFGDPWLAACLTGGDDYEILMAVPPKRGAALREAAREAAIPVTRIGAFAPGEPAVSVENAPPGLDLSAGGWSHF